MRKPKKTTELAALLVAAALLATSGCATTQGQSERHSARETQLVHLAQTENYENLWRAAQLCAELSDSGTEKRPRNQREEFARRGMLHAERAIALQPDTVEGHYYRALCIGRYLDAERLPSFTLVSVLRDEGERAAQIDPRFECSGAHRLLGELYSQAPEFGPGGVGDKAKAEEHFQKAVELSGFSPENHVAYARFLSDMEQFDRAAAEIQKARETIPTCPGLDEPERESLRQRCDELEKQLPRK